MNRIFETGLIAIRDSGHFSKAPKHSAMASRMFD